MILQAGIKKIHYLKDYRNDPYAVELIGKAGATAEKVTLSKKYFAELQLGEEESSSIEEHLPKSE